MGLGPFVDAFVVFWLWGAAVNPRVLAASREPDRRWKYLTWLTVVIATIQAFLRTSALVGGQRRILTSTVGLLTIIALVVGTMAAFWLGRLIQEFGIPRGYGVWLLYGIGSLMTGVHHVAQWVAADAGDPAIPEIFVAYAVVSVALLMSTVIVIDFVLPLKVRKQSGEATLPERTAFNFHLFEGGLVVPIVITLLSINFLLALASILRLINMQTFEIWTPFHPFSWLGVGYHIVFVALAFAACAFATYVRVAPTWLAGKLRKAGEAIPGIPPGSDTVRYIAKLTTSLMLLGAIWMAFVLDLVPLAFQQFVLQSRPHLQVGGGPFVIAALIFITAASRVRRQISA
ncbi:MAG TPA: hypothetical protein VM674_08135 [Candidatus Acidoferrum sp.]|nr:hypothetical protein [Candidatus Acidoferrum sp.]